mgnify:CR=1 FL=1
MKVPMRHTMLVLSLSLLVAACSANGSEDAAAPPGTEPPSTTEAPGATSAPPPETTTTTATTTTTTTTGRPAFDPVPATPPAAFESFAAQLTMEMVLDDITLEMTGEGTWTTDAFECTITTGMGGLTIEQRLVATPETLWLDNGNGFEPTPLVSGPAQEAMAMCPSSPLFWADFSAEELGGRPLGDEEEFAGRAAVKTDLTEVIGAVGSVGPMPGFEDATVNEIAMWVDTETNVVLGLEADIEIGGDFLGEIGAAADTGGDVALLMTFQIDQVNDPSLSVVPPEGG